MGDTDTLNNACSTSSRRSDLLTFLLLTASEVLLKHFKVIFDLEVMLLLIIGQLIVALALDWQSSQLLIDNTTHVIKFASVALRLYISLTLILVLKT